MNRIVSKLSAKAKRPLLCLGFAVLACAGLCNAEAAAAARGTDGFRVGSVQGSWGGYVARFDITSQRGDTWDFDGMIYIKATGQYDRITVRQYGDNHLRIVRYLSGKNAGSTQKVYTYPP